MFGSVKLLNKWFSKEKKRTVEFCERNLNQFLTDDDVSMYESFFYEKNVLYKEYECQSKCKECREAPYAVLNGEFITAETSSELLEKLKNHHSNSDIRQT
ncbi:DUF1450 domain-containing protein [Robertmurraya massiliosenegalensis]|uniref:DUF1450 domain-containing protein n=1 Tax=Robertmurraya massiliosenegalensis TaxID=1287657 RepID=UPI003D2D16D7